MEQHESSLFYNSSYWVSIKPENSFNTLLFVLYIHHMSLSSSMTDDYITTHHTIQVRTMATLSREKCHNLIMVDGNLAEVVGKLQMNCFLIAVLDREGRQMQSRSY